MAAGIWLSDRFLFLSEEQLYPFLLFCYLLLLLSNRFIPHLLLVFWLILGYGIGSGHELSQPATLPAQGMLVIEEREFTRSEAWERYEALVSASRSGGRWYHDRIRIHLYVPAGTALVPGEQLLFSGQIVSPPPPLHRFAFDYRRYLKRQGIAGQLFLKDSLIRVGTDRRSRHHIAILRQKVRQKIDKLISNPDHAWLLAGMLLGEKRGLNEDIRRVYSVTGSMHVLAVSGLHVGLIYFLATVCFSFLPNKNPWTLIRHFLILLLLLSYAALASFSPSVIRAVVFIFLFMLCRLLKRPNPISHVFLLTAFLMLMISPGQLFQVSFQLSFMAVSGIMCFMPWLEPLFSHRWKLPDYLLKNMAMAISVQASTFMLSVHYFHQLSLSFWIAAVLVVPATFLVLILAILMFAAGGFPPAGDWLARLISLILEGVTQALRALSEMPGSYMDDLYWPIGLTSTVTLILTAGIWSVRSGSRRVLFVAAFCLLAWMGAMVHTDIKKDHQRRVAVYYSGDRQFYVLEVLGRRGRCYSTGSEGELPEEIRTWFAGYGAGKVIQHAYGARAGEELKLKIDRGTMVFWRKSNNFPLSGDEVVVHDRQNTDTLALIPGQALFHEIPGINE